MAGVVAAAAAGALASMLFGVLVLTLGSNQVATGLALAIFGTGLSSLIGAGYVGMRDPAVRVSSFPTRSPSDPIGKVVFGYSPLVYFAFIMVGVVGWFLNRTRAGLVLRAVGENDLSAHSIGYSGHRRPLRRDRLRRRDGGHRRRLFLDGHHAAVGGADDRRGAAGSRSRSWSSPAGARGGCSRGAYFFGMLDDAGTLRQGLRLLVPAFAVLGVHALSHGDRRARGHFGARRQRGGEAPACLGKPFMPTLTETNHQGEHE